MGKLLFFLLFATPAFCDVQIYSAPLIRSTIYQDGKILDSREEILFLDDPRYPFGKELIGMQEGEVRIFSLPPLLIEVELIQADASQEAHAASQQEDLPLFSRRGEGAIAR